MAVTKAKLAVLAFEEAEERKRHMAKQAKADRKKESKKRAVQAKLSKKVRDRKLLRSTERHLTGSLPSVRRASMQSRTLAAAAVNR